MLLQRKSCLCAVIFLFNCIMMWIFIGLVVGLVVGWWISIHYHCPSWLAWCVQWDNPLAGQNQAATIIGHLALQGGEIVADVGCGPGRLTLPLARAVGDKGLVVAADCQEAMLDKARAKTLGCKNITFVHTQAQLTIDDLGENRYDYVLLVNVLGEISDQKQALTVVEKMLKPGGVLSVTEVIFDPHFQRLKKVKRLAEEVGLCLGTCFGPWYAYTLHLKK